MREELESAASGWQGAEGVASVASGSKRGQREEAGGSVASGRKREEAGRAENQPEQHAPLFEGQEAGVWNSQVGECG
jgi:hypothetical protein